ncbi:MAG: glycosyltransferase family 4 protein [Candidatus Omnitrophica bacterium]|nr:glycosyltransferase family 4 protein [Candidatus Omnitrophota bacterium]
MQIVIITHEFPPVGGGAASACEHLAGYLSGQGHTVEVLTCRVPGRPLREQRGGFQIRWQLGIRRSLSVGRVPEVFFFLLQAGWYCLRRFRQVRPALVVAFFSLPSGGVGWLMHRVYKVPYVVFVRGCDVPGVHQGWFRGWVTLLRPVIALVCRGAAEVIANSEYLKNLAQPLVPQRSVKVIPNGVDIDQFFPAPAEEKRESLVFVTVGRIDAQKRVEDIVGALAVIRRALPQVPVSLRVVGDGAYRKQVQACCRSLQLASAVTFEGWQPRSQMPRCYQQADVFISASLDESMPNAVLEAMACGLPVIATDIPAHRALLEEGRVGMLVAVRNPQALAAAMELLVRDEARRQALGRAARQAALRYAASRMWALFDAAQAAARSERN